MSKKPKIEASKGRALYLLDANVLIRAHEDYYDIERIPHFWQWLVQQGKDGRIKIPAEIHGEIKGTGLLGKWARDKETKEALLLNSSANQYLQRVIDQGYASDLTEVEYEQLGRDPHLIAHALAQPGVRVVVSKETSKPNAQRANRKVPDVCKTLSIRCVSDFYLFKELDFRTTPPPKS